MTPSFSQTASGPDEPAEILLFEALNTPPEKRAGFLDAHCGLNPALREEVEGLLRDYEKAGTFLSVDATMSTALKAEFARLQPEEEGDRIGPYKLLQQLGEGGFGVVWMAEQEHPVRRRVALKIIKPGMDTKDVVARFEQERQALAVMEHPNIARVLDAGITQFGRPYFVMELVRGIKITQYCDEAQLPTADRLRLFIAVCHAVQHAHQKGIIHRDLKPSNILVTLHDGVPVPKVIDFGVAKAIQQQRLSDLTVFTRFEQMIGTPLYMSPEQAEMSGLDIDTRSDIYSLGVLLYELLTGRTPFDPGELMKQGIDEIRRVIREEDPQKPSTFVSTLALKARSTLAQNRQADDAKFISQIRGDLDWIVMKSLEKDRTRRYETATELAKDIQRHLLSEPVQARRPTPLYRFRRFAKRNKVAFAAGTGIAAALLAGTIVSMWQALRAHRGEALANAALSELRASAPAFAAMSRTLVAKEQFDEAIEKLDVAIKLQPGVAEYVHAKADLLESQFRFAEAASAYREAFRLKPGEKRAETNAALCEKLAGELAAKSNLSRESLVELFNTMTKEQRSAAEMLRAGKLLGEENKLLLSYWLDRLKELPIPPEKPLEQRLTANKDGELALDLSNTEIADLHPLEGMPLGTLSLSRCDKIVSVSPLRGMPLRSLVLDGTEVVGLEPLGTMKFLKDLRLRMTKVQNLEPLRGLQLQDLDLRSTLVSDLTPLRGMPLHTLRLAAAPVSNLTPLAGMPLRILDLASTQVAALAPLAGMPLEELDCTGIPAGDFIVLAGSKLRQLSLAASAIEDLSILKGMPLQSLILTHCDARGYDVLKEFRNLETLAVPSIYDLPDTEFTAIGAIRDYPGLRSIMSHDRREFSSGERFWKEYDAVARARTARAAAMASCRLGDFSAAAHPIDLVLREETILSEVEGYFPIWRSLGVLWLAAGDMPRYRAICQEMNTKFRRRHEGDEETVRLCVLGPECGISTVELRRLMPHLALINPNSSYFCWYVLTNGLLEYRLGNFIQAIALFDQVESERFPAALASAAAALAMANAKQGRPDVATAHLDRARRLIETHWPIELNDTCGWHDWLSVRLLTNEAEQLIGRAALPPAAK